MEHELNGFYKSVLNRTAAQTGYEILLKVKKDLDYDSFVLYACKQDPLHHIDVHEKYRGHLEHFVLNGCQKILRMWNISSSTKMQPVLIEGAGLPFELQQELTAKLSKILPGMKKEFTRDASMFMASSLTRQLTSYPGDLRVEAEIRKEYKTHYSKQKGYLVQNIERMQETFHGEILFLVPEKVYWASTAMNFAYCEIASRITGTRIPAKLKNHPSRKSGEELLHILENTSAPGTAGDHEVVDSWAKKLDLENWYCWVKLEEPTK